jgi:hypothetical protein
MNIDEKKKIRPLYNALQGYLAEAPKIKETYDTLSEESQWKYVNEIIDSLTNTAGKSYDNHKIIPDNGGRHYFVRLSTYRGKLGGLINYLHGEYFSDEPAPLSGNPSMVIHQNQSQQQTMAVTLLDLQDKINQQIQKSEDGNEKSFLEKVKSELPTATSFMQLLQLILSTAHQFGIDSSKLRSFFTS